MPPTYALTPESYALPILHAAQYPSSTVQGVFLAPSASSSSSASQVTVTRSIPLIHIDGSSSIYTEIALEHVEVYAQKEGLSVVGVYEAGAGAVDGGLSRAARGLIRGLKGEVFALNVDNARLGKGENPYSLYTASDPTKPLPPTSLSLPSPDLPRRTLSLIRNRAKSGAVRVHDWDVHMEDPKSDWLVNSAAVELIKTNLA